MPTAEYEPQAPQLPFFTFTDGNRHSVLFKTCCAFGDKPHRLISPIWGRGDFFQQAEKRFVAMARKNDTRPRRRRARHERRATKKAPSLWERCLLPSNL